MSKTKTVNGKDYRWDYKNKKWVQSHGASGGEALKKTASSVLGHVSSWFKKKDNKNTSKLKTPTKTENKGTPVSDHAKTGHTKLVKGPDGKVRRVKVTDTTKDKTLKGSDTSKTMKGKDQGDGGRADWLHKTRNSPAAKAGFSDDERWAQQQRHRAWKESKGKKKSTPKPTPKAKAKVKEKAKVTTKKKKKKVDQTGKPGGKYQFTTM